MAEFDIEQLRQYIGRRVQFRGQECRVIEVLQDGPTLVVECLGSRGEIQPNQYGDANRRVQQTLCIPVLEADSAAPHPDFLALQQACRSTSDD